MRLCEGIRKVSVHPRKPRTVRAIARGQKPPRHEVQKFEKLTLEKEEMMVYSVLDLHPKFLNLIIEETGLNLLTVLGVLEQLRQKHLIQETFPNYFCRML